MTPIADSEMSNQMDRIATKTIIVSEDGPGAYTIMIQRFCAEDHRPLNRNGINGWNTLFTKMDAPPYTTDWSARRWLRTTGFLAHDSPLKEFFLELERSAPLFHALVDGEKYEEAELIEMIDDGTGRQ